MIRLRFKELLADREFKERRVITLIEVAQATKIHRTTLGKIANQPGYNCGLDSLDQLCRYFDCRIDQLAEYVADPVPSPEKKVMADGAP